MLAKEASSLRQDGVPVDVRTITKAVGRSASKTWHSSWPDSFFRRIMGDRMPKPVLSKSRNDAIDVLSCGQATGAARSTCTGSDADRHLTASSSAISPARRRDV